MLHQNLGLPRRLALASPPLPGEALLSWLNAMASEYGGLTRGRAAQITGVLAEGEPVNALRTGRAPYYPHPAMVHRMRAAAALSERQVADMTWHRFRGTALHPIGPEWAAETTRASVLGRWADPDVLRLCPACVDECGGRWLLAWQLPWVFACPAHRCYLIDACPDCGRRFTAHGTDPVRGRCRNRPPADGTRRRQCDAPLHGLPRVPVVDTELFELQRRLWDALHSPAAQRGEAFGIFQDLWAMACLALYTATPTHLGGADLVVREAFAAFCHIHDHRADRDLTAASRRSGRRLKAVDRRSPPVLVMAAVIRTAARIAFAVNPLTAADTLADLSRNPHSPAIYVLRQAWNSGPLALATRDTTERIKSVMDILDYSGPGFVPPRSQRDRHHSALSTGGRAPGSR
ncbi:TniQ family protein [Streptomyces filamentosus]|uniref:TniQ family protein n=1 Tax=Streptomyces filamentosus TaxID=67294 RepID=UPI0036E361BD